MTEHPGLSFKMRISHECSISGLVAVTGLSESLIYKISRGDKKLTPEVAAAIERGMEKLMGLPTGSVDFTSLVLQQATHDLEEARGTGISRRRAGRASSRQKVLA
jgi:hypothetical protein